MINSPEHDIAMMVWPVRANASGLAIHIAWVHSGKLNLITKVLIFYLYRSGLHADRITYTRSNWICCTRIQRLHVTWSFRVCAAATYCPHHDQYGCAHIYSFVTTALYGPTLSIIVLTMQQYDSLENKSEWLFRFHEPGKVKNNGL